MRYNVRMNATVTQLSCLIEVEATNPPVLRLAQNLFPKEWASPIFILVSD